MSITCVVVAYHRPEALARLLRALGDTHERIVVNVEDDPDVAVVAASEGAKLVCVEGNPGFAAAVNAGVRSATGQLVAFMNDDLAVSGDGLEDLGMVVASGAAEVVVPGIRDSSGARERTIAALPSPLRILVEWALLPDDPVAILRWLPIQKWRDPQSVERVQAASAALVLTTRDLLQAEPLPECYFMYWEEAEWFWKLDRSGKVTLYDPRVEATHAGGRHDVRPEKSRLLARNAVRCVRRTQGRPAAMGAWVSVVLWNLRLVAVALARGVTRHDGRPSHLRARLAGLGAAVTAIRELGRDTPGAST